MFVFDIEEANFNNLKLRYIQHCRSSLNVIYSHFFRYL